MADPDDDLRSRHAPLEMSPDQFRAAGHALVDGIADFLGSLRERPVARDATPTAIRALLPAGGVPEEGADAAALLEEARELLVEHSLFNGHPRFLGYITSSAAPIGALADLLAATINPNCGGWQLSPVATEIERQSVRWIAGLLGYPAGNGVLVSGGNLANVAAFLAARRARGGPELRREGVAGRGLVAYASAETHTWIEKAADVSGLGTDAVRTIATDSGGRVDVDALRAAVEADRAAGLHPFLVVGTAGTVSTGAVDPLDRLADLAAEHDLWFHVDGAYGAFGVLAPDEAPAFAGMERADSVAVDPHKWLYVPIEAGCVLVRDEGALADAFAYTPPYYRFTGEDEDPRTNFYALGLQNSRGFRALKVWLALRQVGRAGYARMVADDCRLARALRDAAAAHPDVEAGPCHLSIATLRYRPAGVEDGEGLDALNDALLARLKAGGEAYVSNAVIDGRFWLRACVVNFRTTLDDVRAIPALVARLGRELSGPGGG